MRQLIAQVAGRLIRLPLRLIPNGTVLPVLTGPNRGHKWIAGSSTHGCWLGIYERETQRRIAFGLRPGDIAYDIGANSGYFTLLMSRLVGQSGHVHAFEPLPDNIAILNRHLALNNITNVTVHPVAVSDHNGTVTFQRGINGATGRALVPSGKWLEFAWRVLRVT